MTCAPLALANWTASDPTPPELLVIESRCPATRPASSKIAYHAVEPASGRAATWTASRFDGVRTRFAALVTAYSAKAPV